MVLHIGDHDISGVHVVLSLYEDIKTLAVEYGGDVEFVRVAVTPKQIERYNLDTVPAIPKRQACLYGRDVSGGSPRTGRLGDHRARGGRGVHRPTRVSPNVETRSRRTR